MKREIKRVRIVNRKHMWNESNLLIIWCTLYFALLCVVRCLTTIIVFCVRSKVLMCIRLRRKICYDKTKIMMTAIEWKYRLFDKHTCAIIHLLVEKLHCHSKLTFDTERTSNWQQIYHSFFAQFQVLYSLAFTFDCNWKETRGYQWKDHGSMFNHSRSTLSFWIGSKIPFTFRVRSFLSCLSFLLLFFGSVLCF